MVLMCLSSRTTREGSRKGVRPTNPSQHYRSKDPYIMNSMHTYLYKLSQRFVNLSEIRTKYEIDF